MKVGTDGTLLGAWACPPDSVSQPRILDIGTGTGLIALMMAQRFPEAKVVGIDIDSFAVKQAQQNVAASPFADHVEILLNDVIDMEGVFDAVVSNPPFFTDALKSPDAQRTSARHTVTLSYAQLMSNAWRLLTEEGILSVVVPADYKRHMESEASLTGFFKCRDWAVRTTERKPPKRWLMAFAKHPRSLSTGILTLGSPEAEILTKDFYLR